MAPVRRIARLADRPAARLSGAAGRGTADRPSGGRGPRIEPGEQARAAVRRVVEPVADAAQGVGPLLGQLALDDGEVPLAGRRGHGQHGTGGSVAPTPISAAPTRHPGPRLADRRLEGLAVRPPGLEPGTNG